MTAPGSHGSARIAWCVAALFALAPPSRGDASTPCPIQTEYRVGSYYFPGHFNAARWSPMKAYGKPVPLLGYYRDGAPDVSDWHIKWAVENGLSYFVFDWYYDHRTGHVSGHNAALDQGFLKAKHRLLMEFALMWCNEESPDDPPYTLEQMTKLGENLGRYFREPNYLRLDGRPVVVVSRPARFVKSFGAEFRDAIPRTSRAAGLDAGTDIYFVALAAEPNPLVREMGFAATTAYNYAGHRASKHGSRLRATYDDMVEAYEQIWQKMTAPGELPYLVPVSPGWDSRPWYGPKALVRTGSTPAKFRDMCERAKQYVDPKLKMILAECWNEFGEGSYLEPCEEFGFGYLHALRDTFGAGGPFPDDAVPTAEQKAQFTFRTIPPDPREQDLGEQAGNLIADPGMEEGTGWVDYGGAPSRFVSREPHGGRQCLEIRPDEGCKTVTPTRVAFGRTYLLSAWVKCAPRAEASMRSALFGRDGKWRGEYCAVGETNSNEWTHVQREVRITDPAVGALNLEFVAESGAIWVDDTSVTVAEFEPPPKTVFQDDCSHAGRWITYDGKVPSVQPAANGNEAALVVAAGTGVKTRRQIEVSPGTILWLHVRLKCDPTATAAIQSAAFDANGKWIENTYLGGGTFSWQEWIEVSCDIHVPEDSKARNVNVECVAEGGRVMLGGIEVEGGHSLR